MNWTAMVGDCRDLPLPDELVEAVVTDPPYGLSFMGREWDHDVPGPEYWTEVKRVMKPGAHLLAFGGTRTWHWLTVAIEKAGFEIRDCLSWMYGTGFPKSHDISKAIDKAEGAEREVVGEYESFRPNTEAHANDKYAGELHTSGKITAPATEQAERWDGWGTALKPAWEPIVLAMKPKDGTFAENALEHGVAGLNIDGCRIAGPPSQGGDVSGENAFGQDSGWNEHDNRETEIDRSMESGRWPANVTLSHTRWCRKVGTKRVERRHIEPGKQGGFGDVGVSAGSEAKGTTEEEVEDWDCPPSCPVRQLDEQSGDLQGRGNKGATQQGQRDVHPGGFDEHERDEPHWHDSDGGGASRFYYCAKASRSEREAGLPDVEGRANQHPTVKPIDLCKWLVRLVTRPDHTVLDPFMGSGSIGCAAVQERRDYIGLDLEREYVEIARQRIEHWRPDQRDLFKDDLQE